MKYLLTLDVGTTAVKAGLYNERLELSKFVIREYTLSTPQSNIVELDSAVYWKSAKESIRDVIQGVEPASIVSVTCATQGETLIPVSCDGNALRNAIVWLDSRAASQAQRISKFFDKITFYQKTGLPEINGFCPVAKLLWVKENEPEIYAKTGKFLLLEDFLIFRLSGRYATNPALICSTGYFDIGAGSVWNDILDQFGIDSGKIPPVLPCGTIVGKLDADVASELGLSPDTLVTTGAMDQVASAIGSGNISVGCIAETTGTCQVVAATSEKHPIAEWSPVTVYSHAADGKYLKVVISQTAGMIYKWFRNEFCPDLLPLGESEAFPAMDKLAAASPALCRGLMLYPHLTGMQFPRANEAIRGVFFGVGLDTDRGCFIRAIMEGVGYMLRESIEAMGIWPERILALGGGAKSQLWCQIKADICNVKFETLINEESTSLGAAMLGAVAAGLLNDLAEAASKVGLKKEFLPNTNNRAAYDAAFIEYKKMYDAFAPIFERGNNGGSL